jgi:hypothetical protein
MAYVPKTTYTGSTTASADAVKDILYDLPPGARRKLKTTKEGIDPVLSELATALPAYAKALNLSEDTLKNIQQCTDNMARLAPVKEETSKLDEVVGESYAHQEDLREVLIAQVAKAAQEIGSRVDPTVLAAFEATLNYHSQIADKAAATRRKNEEAKAEAEAKAKAEAESKARAEKASANANGVKAAK